MKRSLALAFALVVVLAFGPTTRPTAAAPGGPPIVLGVPTALGSIEGADSLRSVQLAVEEINARGGVTIGGQKRPLQVVSIDTREHEPGIPIADALAALEKLITERKPHAIVVGAFRSEVLLAAMDLVARYKIPYIVTIAVTPEFERKLQSDYAKYKYHFRMGLNAPFLVGGLTQVMGFLGSKYGMNRVHFIHQDVLWARGTTGGLAAWARRSEWAIGGMDAYPTGATDFAASLVRARANHTQVIVPIFDMPQSGILVKQARGMEVSALFAGFISPAAPETAWQAFEGGLEGLVNFIFEPGPMPMRALPKSMQYNRNYGKKFGEEARQKLSGHGPGPSYDAVYVLAAAMERGGSLEADRVVDELKKTNVEGVIGRIRFNENHQVIFGTNPRETAVSLAFQWVKGRRVVVFPEAAAEAVIQLPPGYTR